MKRPKGPPAPEPPAAPFNNPFAKLKAEVPPEQLAPDVPAPPPPLAVKSKAPPRAAVRMERKGRGGKEVTIIEHLGLDTKASETWLKALKSSLGTGGVVEDGALIVQGDHRERVKAWLISRGVTKVSVG